MLAGEIGAPEADRDGGPDAAGQGKGVRGVGELDRLGSRTRPELLSTTTAPAEIVKTNRAWSLVACARPEQVEQQSPSRRATATSIIERASAPQELKVHREAPIHHHSDSCRLELPCHLVVPDALLHPDQRRTDLEQCVQQRRNVLRPAEDVHDVDRARGGGGGTEIGVHRLAQSDPATGWTGIMVYPAR